MVGKLVLKAGDKNCSKVLKTVLSINEESFISYNFSTNWIGLRFHP